MYTLYRNRYVVHIQGASCSNIAVILGSTRDGRFGPAVANWVMDHLDQRGDMSADLIDLIETPLPTVLPVLGQPPASQRTGICWRPSHRAWRQPTPSSS